MLINRTMIACWHPDPAARPTFTSLLAQLKEISNSDVEVHNPAVAVQLQVSE